MTLRRIALIASLPMLLATGFYLAYSHPEVFVPRASHAIAKPDATFGESYAPPVLTPSELKAKLDRGESLVIADVRGLDSFTYKHIEGALSMPASEITTWGPKLKPEELVVFYCS